MTQIAEILKYEGDNSSFIWKHPCEDFNSLTQLIVHESQEAIFFMNGQALDLFGPGRYTLETQNIPEIGKFLNRTTGDETPFHCEVYFINKTEQMSIKWGTDSKVQYIEPTYGFPISIGASGEMSMLVRDGRKLLLKPVGTENFLGQAKLVSLFRAFLMTKVKTYISRVIKEQSINIFEIDEKLVTFSDNLKSLLIPDFSDYGIALELFFVTSIVKPDGDVYYEKFKELYFRQYADVAGAKIQQQVEVINAETKAQKTLIESKALAAKRVQEGYTYQQERGFDIATEVAKNEAVGQFTNMGVGLGTMAGVGGAVGSVVGSAVNNAMTATEVQGLVCQKCSSVLPENAQFCFKCGEKVATQETMICPSCGKTVAKGKFCIACGHSFVAACPNCGEQIPEGAQFCMKCGQKF